MTYDHWKATNPADEFLGPEPEPEDEPEWEFFSGPFVSLSGAIASARYLNEGGLAKAMGAKFGVWPDPNTTTKWIIKRTWQ